MEGMIMEALLGNVPMDDYKMNQLHNLLNDSLIITEHVQNCALIRKKDYQLRANSVGFNLSSEQVRNLVDAFKSCADLRENGLMFNHVDYSCVRADEQAIYAKHNHQGLILVQTATLLVLGTYIDRMQPSICVEAVEKLGDYFREKGL